MSKAAQGIWQQVNRKCCSCQFMVKNKMPDVRAFLLLSHKIKGKDSRKHITEMSMKVDIEKAHEVECATGGEKAYEL